MSSLPPPIPPPPRPVLVWIISGYICVSMIFAAFSLWVVHAGILPLPPAQRSYFESLSWVDNGASSLVMVINLAGAVALFFLRRVAMYLFAFGLLVAISLLIYHIIAKNYLQAMGAALPGAIVRWVIRIAVIIYARHLTQKGVLR